MKTNKHILISKIIAGAFVLVTATTGFAQTNTNAQQPDAIRPFHAHISDEAVADLRQRVQATRWAEKETVTDRSQGAQLEKMQALVKYWGTDYNWRKAEDKLNALPQFITNIDGLDI